MGATRQGIQVQPARLTFSAQREKFYRRTPSASQTAIKFCYGTGKTCHGVIKSSHDLVNSCHEALIFCQVDGKTCHEVVNFSQVVVSGSHETVKSCQVVVNFSREDVKSCREVVNFCQVELNFSHETLNFCQVGLFSTIYAEWSGRRWFGHRCPQMKHRLGGAVSPLTAAGCQRTHSGLRRRRARSDAPYHAAPPKTATGTGALPSQVPVGGRAPAPANGSLGWTNGALVGTLRGDVPAGAFPLLASGISACPPGTGKRGPADGAARHPYHGATPKTATGTGALPGNVPVGGRAQAPANGSLGWTNRAKCMALKNPKGISSFSPALTVRAGQARSGYAGW